MKILGLGTASFHDASAALIIDGQVISACEEERLSRNKHAFHEKPILSAKYCLDQAGLSPKDIDSVAIPWSPLPYKNLKLQYLARNLTRRPSKALKTLFKPPKVIKKRQRWVRELLEELQFSKDVKISWIEHHLAHASSSFHFSGWDDAAILSIDGMGERSTLLFAEGNDRKIEKIHEVVSPDSLGIFYGALTDFLGFQHLNGEYKMMGMASYGDPSKVDISKLLQIVNNEPRLNLKYIFGKSKSRKDSTYYNYALEELLGPPRQDEGLSEPYIHIAAAAQNALNQTVLQLIDHYLSPALKRTGRLCVAGGVALNVQLNKHLRDHPLVEELYVQPAAADNGLSLGAASYSSEQHSIPCQTMRHAYWGPEYSDQEIEEALKAEGVSFSQPKDIIKASAELLSQGEVLAWFQGRMEWGPRALGNRSILGNPAHPGVSDLINSQIKFRETWRPFCPAILDESLAEVVDSDHPSPFMNMAFKVSDLWKERIKEAVHVDQTIRPQGVSQQTNPKFHELITEFKKLTDIPVLLNTSLNRRGEPMACSPQDALKTFLGSGLKFLAIGSYLVTKSGSVN